MAEKTDSTTRKPLAKRGFYSVVGLAVAVLVMTWRGIPIPDAVLSYLGVISASILAFCSGGYIASSTAGYIADCKYGKNHNHNAQSTPSDNAGWGDGQH